MEFDLLDDSTVEYKKKGKSNSNVNISEPTPSIKQYLEIKAECSEYILFFRMGDFYELFFEDAVVASHTLGIVLTKRGTYQGKSIPMCGVPFHSYENYAKRLIQSGYNVAICNQLPQENVSSNGKTNKALIKRELVRIMTPGTLIEESLIESNSYNYLASLFLENEFCYVSWLDITTGDFYTDKVAVEEINNLLYKISPKEILVHDNFNKEIIYDDFAQLVRVCPNSVATIEYAKNIVQQFAINNLFLRDYQGRLTISIGLLLDYILLTQRNSKMVLRLGKINKLNFLDMDFFTRRSLELTKNQQNTKGGTLKAMLDGTKTSMGARIIHDYLENPLAQITLINERLDAVTYFISEVDLLQNTIKLLANLPDLERLVHKISFYKRNPSDFFMVRQALQSIFNIKNIFIFRNDLPSLLKNLSQQLLGFEDLLIFLTDRLQTDYDGSDTNFLNLQYYNHLQVFVSQKQDILRSIALLADKYTLQVNINSLKISFTAIDGYYIEVPTKFADDVINKGLGLFTHKKTLSNAIRYTTKELIDLEFTLNKINAQVDGAIEEIIVGIKDEIVKYSDSVKNISKAIGAIDVLSNFAKKSIDNSWVRPTVDNTADLDIQLGRHVVVESHLKTYNYKNNDTVNFVANDCYMNTDKNLFLITGPNMSGKSTYLRQNALIIIMAQVGCFVPAKSARIGVVDAIYSRVGASDDIAKGQSTFMVEMLELATILKKATNRSFIILDEVGRGTSTYDGLSIAWATLEYLHNVMQTRTIFATHYHELVNLEDKLKRVICYYVKIAEHNNKLIFLHSLAQGYVNKSYGIDVAKLAGVPAPVIARAQEILHALESSENKEQHSLFNNALTTETASQHEESYAINSVLADIKTLSLDDLTPRQAYDLLCKYKKDLLS